MNTIELQTIVFMLRQLSFRTHTGSQTILQRFADNGWTS